MQPFNFDLRLNEGVCPHIIRSDLVRGRNNHCIRLLLYHRFMVSGHAAICGEDNHLELMRQGYHPRVFYALLPRAGLPQCTREMGCELFQEKTSLG